MTENEIAKHVLDAAFVVHSKIGPGVLESVVYDGIRFDEAFRSDLVVEGKVIAELKSVQALSPVHAKQILTQLRLTGLKLGLLINFGEAHLKNGIKRVINGQLEEKSPADISL